MATTATPISQQTFPGVYSNIVDASAVTTPNSNFMPGLVGVAAKGPFDVATTVSSLSQYIQTFGQPVPGNNYLGYAVAMCAPYTNAMSVVRVGNQYVEVAGAAASGYSSPSGTGPNPTLLYTQKAAAFDPSLSPTGAVYVRVTEPGVPSTVGAVVTSINATVEPYYVALASDLAGGYNNADVSLDYYGNAANTAEAVLYGYTYGSAVSGPVVVTAIKNSFSFVCSGTPSTLTPGKLIRIMQTNRISSHELLIKSVGPTIAGQFTVQLYTTNNLENGYQALPLQDTYSSGATISLVTGVTPAAYVHASSAGSWANGNGNTTGLAVTVSPGSAPGSKKFLIYWNSALQETIDNCTNNPSDANYYVTVLSRSQFIGNANPISPVAVIGQGGLAITPANSASGWNLTPPVPLPNGSSGNINAGVNSAGSDTGGTFTAGADGSNPQTSDFVGTVDPASDTFSGIRCFEDTDNVVVTDVCAPMDNIVSGVVQQLDSTATIANAVSLVDVPSLLNSRAATDWTNGVGPNPIVRINSWNTAFFWNWFTISSPFTGSQILVPPTLGALRCLGFTTNTAGIWHAAAGQQNGLIPEAISVTYPRISLDAKSAMYGNGNCINPIIVQNGNIVLYGNITALRPPPNTTDAMQQISVVHLINYIVDGMAAIAQRFVFQPNDPQLLQSLSAAIVNWLKTVQSQQGILQFGLVCDSSNNTAATLNAREAFANLYVIPIGAVERIFLTTTVSPNGATLLGVNS